jgi:hypothetical protein
MNPDTNERHWPGTTHFIGQVDWLILQAVQRQAAQEAAEDLIASGPAELLEDGR